MGILYHFHNFYFYVTYIDNSYAFSLDNKIKSKTIKRFDLVWVQQRLKSACNAYIIDAEIGACTSEHICKFARLRRHKNYMSSRVVVIFHLNLIWRIGKEDWQQKWSQIIFVSVYFIKPNITITGQYFIVIFYKHQFKFYSVLWNAIVCLRGRLKSLKREKQSHVHTLCFRWKQ